MFEQIIQNAIAQIEATRQRHITDCKQKVTQEKIVPFNAEIDSSLRAAISEVQQETANKITAIQQEFEATKKRMQEVAEAKKSAFATQTIEEAIAMINLEADTTIAHFQSKLHKEG
jgi:hypothetical protein